jgi:hypothetical protein
LEALSSLTIKEAIDLLLLFLQFFHDLIQL